MRESVGVVAVGTGGCHALDVKHSQRLWYHYHERHCITLVTAGQAHWRYRNRYSEASVHGVMLMEPGEVHANTSIEQAGSFLAVCLTPDQVADWSRDYRLKDVHFGAQFLRAKPCIAALSTLQAMVYEAEPAAVEDQLTLVFRSVLTQACESPLVCPGRATTLVRRGAKMLEERYREERWRTVDIKQVASALGMSYHWFVHSFKVEFGLPPYRFVQSLRSAYARALLAAGPDKDVQNLRDVAMAAGYADAPHMTREFRRTYGMTPGEMARGMSTGWKAPLLRDQGRTHVN